MTIKQAAQSFLDSGLNILPVKKTKSPAVASWDVYKTELYPDDLPGFDKAWGVGVICGDVSEGLECIDFDPKVSKEHIRSIFNAFAKDPGVKNIIARNKCYIQKTQSGGYHFVYKYECDERRDGSKKLALTEDGHGAIIETRGEGGYFIAAPSPGYDIKLNTLEQLAIMTIDERDYLIEKARSFCMKKRTGAEPEPDADQEHFDNTDPISFFNWNKADYAKQLLRDKGCEMVSYNDKAEQWRRPGKDDGISATWGFKYNALYVFSTDGQTKPFQPECYYTPFQILSLIRFKGNYNNAISWIYSKYYEPELFQYIRVGVDYFKLIKKTDRYGIEGTELRPWKKEEIKQDHGADFVKNISKFDSFHMKPSNVDFEPVVGNNYNLYKPFRHTPQKGSTKWTDILMEQIFGEQIDLGYRYMKLLYEHPDRHAPILVLVSKIRGTGKTTFLNWINMVFSDNFTMLTPEVFKSDFNSMYAFNNIIAIEETKIEKDSIVQKLKAVSTQKMIAVNQKYVAPFSIPFFGKFILTSNDEEKFARIDQEEIRFFVRNLKHAKVTNHNIEKEVSKEIPAFLYKLQNEVPAVDFSVSRNGFKPEELENEGLKNVKEESKSWLYKELYEYIREYFLDNPDRYEMEATPTDIKNRWYERNSRAEIGYIKHVLKNEYGLNPEPLKRYDCIYGNNISKKVGTPYSFKRENFIKESEDVNSVNNEFTDENAPF
jgi:hypothetical protein